MNFADDLAVLSHTQSQMQGTTDKLNRISGNAGLSTHPEKSKVLKSGRVSEDPTTLENSPLEEIESLTYLGSIREEKSGTEADVDARIGKARTAFTQLQKIWEASKISQKTKIRLFNSYVKSVLCMGVKHGYPRCAKESANVHQQMPPKNPENQSWE